MNKQDAINARIKGYSVIPLQGGDINSDNYKKPLIPWEPYQSRLATIPEINSWDTDTYGIVTGQISNLLVIDFDTDEEPKPELLAGTFRVKTKRGHHIYYKYSDLLNDKVTTKTEILPKVDVRGQGGYVVAWDLKNVPHRSQLADLPDSLLALLPNKDNKAGLLVAQEKQDSTWLQNELMSIKPGEGRNGRTPTFVRVIGWMKSKGILASDVKTVLQPWADKYEYTKLDVLIADQYRRYPAPVQNVHQGTSVEEFLLDSEPVKWICEPFIAEQSIGIIGGLPESRKSWIMLDLAIEVARGGGKWLGKFDVKSGKVLLIDQERSKSEVQRRIKALIAGKDLNAKELKDNLFVRAGTTTRIDLQHSFDALRKEVGELKPDLILVDSFATFHTKEESNRMEIQQVMERLKQLRTEFGCSILLIHHETKASYQNHKEGSDPSYMDLAGNVAIPAAAEMCISVVKHDDDSSFVHHTKSTQGTKSAPFLVKVVDLNAEKTKIEVRAY